MKKNLVVSDRSEFVKLLEAISKINDSAILEITDNNRIVSLVSSTDNTLILSSEYYNIQSEYNKCINLPDIKKLIRVIDSLSTKDFACQLNHNNLEYSDATVKFKYHLYEDGFLAKPPVNINKINSFEYDIQFNLSKEQVQSLLRSSSFTSDTNKIYFYTEDGKLKGELTDRAKHNTDALSVSLKDVDFTLNYFSLNLDNIKTLTMLDEDILFKINSKFGVMCVEIQRDNIKLQYIITSLTQ